MKGQEFLNKYKDRLIQIYIRERTLNFGQLGALFIDFTKKENADVYFLTLKNMPDDIRQEFERKDNLEQKNTVFLYIIEEERSYIMDVLV